jgi:hypothetical protein
MISAHGVVRSCGHVIAPDLPCRHIFVPAVQAPHPSGNNNRNALLRDPDGNLVELVDGPSAHVSWFGWWRW